MFHSGAYNLYIEIAEITDEILYTIRGKLPGQKTEQGIIDLILDEIAIRNLYPSFSPFVASGSHTLCLRPTNFSPGKLHKGFLMIDFGIKYKGLNSDMTRMFFIGEPDTEELRDYALVRDLQEKVIAEIEPGMKFSKLDIFTSQITKRGKYITGRLGHGIGNELHQKPLVRGSDELCEGSVFTIEPSLYFEDKGYGIRLEDMVVIKNNEVITLTGFPKDIMELTIPA